MLLFKSGCSFSDQLAAITRHLASGDRKDAAYTSTFLAKRSDDPDELRALIRVLARALEDVGDKHKRRGRPDRPRNLRLSAEGQIIYELDLIAEHPDKWISRLDALSLQLAARVYDALLVARDVHDGLRVSADDLAMVLWSFVGTAEDVGGTGTAPEKLKQSAAAIRANMPAALDAVRAAADAGLREYGLLNAPRQGFRALARRKVAARHRLTVDQLKRAH
jgi:hypothetical protein